MTRRRKRRTLRGKIRRLIRLLGLLLLLAATGLALWLAFQGKQPTAGAGTANTAANQQSDHGNLSPIQLPADESPHHEVFMEWWYYNGHLDAADGRSFGFHYTIFVVNPLIRHTVAHISLVDISTGKHYGYDAKTPGRVSSGKPGEFIFTMPQLRLRGGPGPDTLEFSDTDWALDLTLNDRADAVMHDGDGLLDFGKQGGYTYYYTRPRIPITGTLMIDGQRLQVTGDGWFDHQWGDFTPHDDGWDWFALQLDDGRDLMVFLINDLQGNILFRGGSVSDQSSRTTNLATEDIGVKTLQDWTSPATGRRYPSGWQLDLKGFDAPLTISVPVPNSEFDARGTTTNIYWEGPVVVSGGATGRGYVELTGYGE